MTEPPTGTLLIVSGASSEGARGQSAELAGALSARLDQPVVLCLSQDPGEPVAAGIRTLLMSGVQRLVIVPLDLPPKENSQETPFAIKWASRRWPFLIFHGAAPLDWPEWVAWLKEAPVDSLPDAKSEHRATVLLVGAGCADSLTNANLARLAHLMAEASDFARVDYAFLDTVRPCIKDAIQIQARLGARNIIIVPWLLFNATAVQRLMDEVNRAANENAVRLTVATAPLVHRRLIDLLISHHQSALADHSFLAPSWTEIQAEIAGGLGSSTHGPGAAITAEEEAQLRELDRKINEILPPAYQSRYEQVSPKPMGSAPLQLGPDGQVAWNEMWTSFCDLALAGGPPHRGTLLEAVSAAEVLAEPERYQAVVAEIERGIRLVTGLPLVPGTTPGWVGIRCDSEEMAIWLMRAIIVENVMVRRERDVIYLPAGPHFTLKHEIKNIVTVIAKTTHYWTAHIVAKRQGVKRPSAASTAATPV